MKNWDGFFNTRRKIENEIGIMTVGNCLFCIIHDTVVRFFSFVLFF